MSYHKGYAWNDGVERGVVDTLSGKCELKKFYMDTKRNKEQSFAKIMALKAKSLIEEYQPDIVIVSDDNAARFLVMPYYKNAKLPFVFSGINWTAEEYGFPYANVTGMVEVAPILPLLEIIKQTVPGVKSGVFLSSDVLTEHKDFMRYKKVFNDNNVELKSIFVSTTDEWIEGYRQAQSADFIITSNNAGINDWDKEIIIAYVLKNSTKFTVTNYDWMMPYVMLALKKSPYEQGRWSAEVALIILSGVSPAEIPVTVNKEWNILVNLKLLDSANIVINKHTLRRASHLW